MNIGNCCIATSAVFLLNTIPLNSCVHENKSIIYQDNSVQMQVPECPLGPGAIQFSSKIGIENLEIYNLMQNLISFWKTQGIVNYLIYEKNIASLDKKWTWEIVPYQTKGSTFLKQFSVLKNIIFGGTCLSEEERNKEVKDFQKHKELFSIDQVKQIKSIEKIAHGNDVFCKPEVIERQRIWEGKEVNVLYNYAPIALSDEKLHFLIVPKMHRETFSDLSPTEYLEVMQFAQKLVDHYYAKGIQTAYLFNKNGEEAGQTVSHWHMHVVFAATNAQELFGKLFVLKNMVFDSSPMPKEEFDKRIQTRRNELTP
jgi:diadenosine tetraphosphate (Ap4A) HIT family hydrolase